MSGARGGRGVRVRLVVLVLPGHEQHHDEAGVQELRERRPRRTGGAVEPRTTSTPTGKCRVLCDARRRRRILVRGFYPGSRCGSSTGKWIGLSRYCVRSEFGYATTPRAASSSETRSSGSAGTWWPARPVIGCAPVSTLSTASSTDSTTAP